MKIKKEFNLIAALVAMALMGSQAAFADVTAVYKLTYKEGGSGTQTIRYVDKQHVRVDMKIGKKNHETTMLKLGDKVYTIMGTVVQDMDQLKAMMGAMGKGKKDTHTKPSPIKFKDTGKTETIAGIAGKVYSFKERGKQHEIVLGKSQDLQKAVLGLIEISKVAASMISEDGMNQTQQDAAVKNMAMLRLDNYARLQSLKTTSIPASVFTLPAKPQEMGGFGKMMKGLLGH
jgi:hypothetical protein